MALSISAPVGAWEDPIVKQKGGNKKADIIAVQTLLTKAAAKTGNQAFKPVKIDGGIARAPKTSNTLEALYHFQKQFLPQPDRRVDVGGRTWRELQKYDDGAPVAGGDSGLSTAIGPPQLITYNGQRVPFFTQFDATWGTRKLGSNKTLSAAGCAITSIAMILKYYGRDMDPKKLDEYLDDHNGYSGDNVVWATALKAGEVAGKPKLTLTNAFFSDSAQFATVLAQRIAKNWPTLAHLDYGSDVNVTGDHWVVVVGRNANGNFIINDPGTSQGNGAANPGQKITIIGESTRKSGLNLVRLCLFDVT